MATVLENPQTTQTKSTSERLRFTMAAARISFNWFGTRKSLSTDQKSRAADTFGAEGEFLSAAKKLLDTKHPSFRAVTAVKGRMIAFWKGSSLPFPEAGIRLIRQDSIDAFNQRMLEFTEELDEAVRRLDRQYDEMKSAARERLGSLYNSSDYPASLQGLFEAAWDFPSIEAPDYLRQLNPELYEQECGRVRARFDEAVQLAESAFMEELQQLVVHLSERLSGRDDGKQKIFRDSAVENFTEFFERFQTLNINSNAELDELVARAQAVVRGVEPNQLRKNGSLRHQIATQLASVQSSLDDLLVERPRRNILRRPK
jgi:hypothetical protein